jgi:molybdate transport system substrate-binding protein
VTRRLLLCGLLLPLAACGGDDADGLTVLAAASLTDVYRELAVDFAEETGREVTFSFGSSTELAQQAADGAPGDVLATADEAAMRIATDAGVAGAATEFARNELVLVTPSGNPAGVDGLSDLAGTTWVRCADTAPCGRVALAVLDGSGVSAEPASLEEDVRATLDKVVSGEADAGLVYATDAVAAGDDVEVLPVADAEEQPTSCLVAVLDQAADPDLAARWVDLVTSREGRSALQGAGFAVP